MYLNHIQEKFQISTFGGIPVEFGSMDKKNLDFTTNMKFWAKTFWATMDRNLGCSLINIEYHIIIEYDVNNIGLNKW